MIKIHFITTNDCPKCYKTKTDILDLAKTEKVGVDIVEIDSSTQEAVRLGLKYGLDDVPSFVVKGVAFCGSDFNKKKFVNILRN